MALRYAERRYAQREFVRREFMAHGLLIMFFSVDGDKCCFGEQIVQHCVVYDEIKVIFVCKLKSSKIKCHSVTRVGCSVGPYQVSPLTGSTKPPRNQLYSLYLWLSYHVACRLPGGICPAIQNMHSSCLRREEKKVLRDYLIFIILGRCWRFAAALIGCRARARGKKL